MSNWSKFDTVGLLCTIVALIGGAFWFADGWEALGLMFVGFLHIPLFLAFKPSSKIQ